MSLRALIDVRSDLPSSAAALPGHRSCKVFPFSAPGAVATPSSRPPRLEITRPSRLTTRLMIRSTKLRSLVPASLVLALLSTSAPVAAQAPPLSESIVVGVPTGNPRVQAVLEASFDPGRLLDDDDFATLNTAAALGGLVLEAARMRTPPARGGRLDGVRAA